VEVEGQVRIRPTLLCSEVLVLEADTRILASLTLSEATCAPCASNPLALAISPNIHLPVGTRISLEGLSGTPEPLKYCLRILVYLVRYDSR